MTFDLDLFPGNFGIDCMYDGNKKNSEGQLIPCCCDQCDYYLRCEDPFWQAQCRECSDFDCPRKNK